jgi:hypothetical protein
VARRIGSNQSHWLPHGAAVLPVPIRMKEQCYDTQEFHGIPLPVPVLNQRSYLFLRQMRWNQIFCSVQ